MIPERLSHSVESYGYVVFAHSDSLSYVCDTVTEKISHCENDAVFLTLPI